MDVETFVYHNGRIEPAIQAENSTTPDIWIDHEPNYDQFEDQTNGTADVEAFVFSNCMVVPASQSQNSSTPVINTAPETNYAR